MEPSKERILQYPHHIWDCERCGSEDSMRIRRSSLNGFEADDILLKCNVCKFASVHGVEIEGEKFEEELEKRKNKYGRRSIDINKDSEEIDASEDKVKEMLESLGYIE